MSEVTYTTRVKCPQRPKGIGFPGTGVVSSCGLIDRLGTELGHLQEECMFLNGEPSLQSLR